MQGNERKMKNWSSHLRILTSPSERPLVQGLEAILVTTKVEQIEMRTSSSRLNLS